MKKILLYSFVAVSIWSCKKNNSAEDPELPSKDSIELVSVKIEAKNNVGKITSDVDATITNSEINVLLPAIEAQEKLVVTFTVKNASVTVNDVAQISGTTLTDFTKPVNYKLTSAKGAVKNFKFNVRNFTGIPILYLTTSAKVESKDNYVNGSVSLNTNQWYEQEKQHIALEIKGRGNSTWGMPKKPYRLKFNEKAEVLGMAAAKNWVLLANYSDKTLLRTNVAFDLGNKIGAAFTPKSRFVELVMNGEHLGSYLLTSQVEVNENRVNITELKKGNTSDEEITGGYLLEQDERLDEVNWFRTTKNLPFTIKSPDNITPAQLAYIKNYIQQTEDAIYSTNFADPVNGYAKYINTESFVSWFLVQELMKNQDAKDFSSIFYFKDRNGKLNLGPLWDFDLGAGNNDYSDSRYSNGWWIKDGPWFRKLFNDPVFKEKVKSRWNAIKNKELKEINTTIDQSSAYINLSQKRNFEKWKILNVYVWPNQFVLGTYDAEVQQLKKWLDNRISWMDTELNKL